MLKDMLIGCLLAVFCEKFIDKRMLVFFFKLFDFSGQYINILGFSRRDDLYCFVMIE